MASYLRSLFGGGQSTKKSSPSPSSTSSSSRDPKPHRRSQSAANATYIYTSSGARPVRRDAKRSESYSSRPVPPSPLRYDTYDSTTKTAYGATTGHVHDMPTRTPLYKSSSYKHEYHLPYPIYSSSVSHCGSDSRTNSSASIHPSSLSVSSSTHSHCVVAPPPRTSSSVSVPHDVRVRRPVLKQTHTWHAGTAPSTLQPHVSFQNPNRAETIHMHPLLASSRLHSAPISYDVTYTPSPKSVVDRNTRTPVPSHTLAQPATDPPTFTKLVLRCDKLPWPVIVQASAPKGGKFFIGTRPSSSSSSANKVPISNQDLLCALHNTLSVRVSHEEWEALGHGTRAQRKVTRAYEARCKTMGGGWDGGVRRIDWLGERTRLIGIDVDKDAGIGGVAKLVFGKP